jgi:dihydropteroate synthase
MSRRALRAVLGHVTVGDELPVALVGVLNVSPESFYAASIHTTSDDLVRAADEMVAAGAALLDVGAMSTAPYRDTRIGEAEEADRLAAAVGRLHAKFDVPVSADTSRLGPARAALDAGAAVLNDVTGLRGDAAMASLIAARGAGVIVMARASAPGTAGPGDRPIDVVAAWLQESLEIAHRAGVPEDRIVVDPGIGFFRDGPMPWFEWDASVVAHLDALRRLGRPIGVGVSRKSFIGALTGRDDPGERLAGSLAATAIAVHNGAALVRTHDVGACRDAVLVAAAMRP